MCNDKTLGLINRELPPILENHLSLDDHSSCWDVRKIWEMTAVNCIARSFRGNCSPKT